MDPFVYGVLVTACGVIGLFFLRFWKKSREPLFVFFSLAFWLLGVNWAALAFTNTDELRTALYAVRLVAFLLILMGIWSKNRTRTGRE